MIGSPYKRVSETNPPAALATILPPRRRQTEQAVSPVELQSPRLPPGQRPIRLNPLGEVGQPHFPHPEGSWSQSGAAKRRGRACSQGLRMCPSSELVRPRSSWADSRARWRRGKFRGEPTELEGTWPTPSEMGRSTVEQRFGWGSVVGAAGFVLEIGCLVARTLKRELPRLPRTTRKRPAGTRLTAAFRGHPTTPS